MKNIFLLLLFVLISYASTPRSTNFTSENAGAYTLYSVTVTSNSETITSTFSNNQACTTYHGETTCVETDNMVYELVMDSNGNLIFSNYDNQYIEQGSIYDESINASIIFNTNSFSYCDNEEGEDVCITFIKTAASQPTDSDEYSQDKVVAQTEQQEQYVSEVEMFDYASTAQKEKFREILGDIKADSSVENAYLAENGLGLLIDYIAGYSGVIAVAPEGDKGMSSKKKLLSKNIVYSDKIKKITHQLITKNRLKTANLLRSGKSSIGNNKVLAFMAQHWDWNDNDDVPLIANLLEADGYDVTRISYDSEGEGKLQDFKNWDTYGIVLISTHGLSGNYKDRTGYKKSSHVTLLQTNIFVTSKDDALFHDDLLAGRLYFGNKKYYITQEFISHYNEKFPNSFIYISACKGAKHDYMANAFLEKDAGAYVSWSDNVKVSFAQEQGLNLFNDLLKDSETSIYDVYKIPDNYNGSLGYKTGIKESDPDKEPAELIVYTRNNLKLNSETLGEEASSELTPESLKILLNKKTYDVNGEFSYYDFEGIENAFDWVYKDAYGYAQLQGKPATETNVFGWKDITLDTEPIPSWYLVSLGGDIDNDGSNKFDWMILSTDMDNQQVYKLSGVSKQGTFTYLGPIDLKYSLSNDRKKVIFENK